MTNEENLKNLEKQIEQLMLGKKQLQALLDESNQQAIETLNEKLSKHNLSDTHWIIYDGSFCLEVAYSDPYCSVIFSLKQLSLLMTHIEEAFAHLREIGKIEKGVTCIT